MVCGTTSIELVNIYNSEVLDLPIYCDNRCCDNPGCKKHRLYKFQKEHCGQEIVLQKSIRKPKGWVFTGWNKPIEDFTRDFCRMQFLKLFYLLKRQALSEFSIHMELKLNEDGSAYLHFHVVAGGLKDFRFTQKSWGRIVRYQTAIRPKDLARYISKYASKTPRFYSDSQMLEYHRLVYKTQMHRFSCNDKVTFSPEWVTMESLVREVRSSCYQDSYLNPSGRHRYYFKILENFDKPPDYRGRPWLKSCN